MKVISAHWWSRSSLQLSVLRRTRVGAEMISVEKRELKNISRKTKWEWEKRSDAGFSDDIDVLRSIVIIGTSVTPNIKISGPLVIEVKGAKRFRFTVTHNEIICHRDYWDYWLIVFGDYWLCDFFFFVLSRQWLLVSWLLVSWLFEFLELLPLWLSEYSTFS